jgi:hypothetical protein
VTRRRLLTYGLYPALAALVQFAYRRHHSSQDALSVTHAFLAIAPLATSRAASGGAPVRSR